MTKEEKIQLVDELTEKLSGTPYFYITDTAGLSVAQINAFRRLCFEKGIRYQVVKNSLIKKALERLDVDYTPVYDCLKGSSGIMFGSEVGKAPAEVIKEFRKKFNSEKPLFKAASIDSSLFLGEESLETLATLKSREELIGEVVMLIQSPARRVVGAIKSGGGRVAAMVKGIAEKAS
jgi:large subunit ribosomal protein L10